MKHAWALTLILPLVCTSCLLGPNYTRPHRETPKTWTHVDQPGITQDPSHGLCGWWKVFGDPILDELIDTAVAQNLDLKIACARLREARAVRREVSSRFWPQVDGIASYNRSRLSSNAPFVSDVTGLEPAVLTVNEFIVGFDVSWEIDIFGRTRRATEAASYEICSAVYNTRDVLVTLLAEVASTYIELRGSQKRILVANRNVEDQQVALEIAQARYNAGLTSALDVFQAQRLKAGTESEIPPFEADVARTIHRLGVLLALDPADLEDWLSEPELLPPQPPSIPIGMPSELLRQRPDIRRAEYELAASTARIGVAVADLFPRFNILSAFGFEADSLRPLLTWPSRSWEYGFKLLTPIFQGGRLRARVEQTRARQCQAYYTYENTILTAFEEVRNTLVEYQKEQERYEWTLLAREAATNSLNVAAELYLNGLTTFLEVVDADRALNVFRDQLIVSETLILLDSISLFKALGGGWDCTGDESELEPAEREESLIELTPIEKEYLLEGTDVLHELGEQAPAQPSTVSDGDNSNQAADNQPSTE